MSQDKELDNMPIWQNHEQRITTLEVTMSGLSNKMDNVEKTVKDGNEKAEKKLDVIDNRLMDEFFYRKRSEQDSEVDIKKINQENKWKLILKVVSIFVGAGSFIWLLIEKLIGG